MITLVISVFTTKKRLFVQSLLTITIPTALFAIIILAIMLSLNVNIWYYNVDVVVTQVCFHIVAITCYVNITKHVEEIRLKNIFTRLILPSFVGTAAYLFSEVYLFNKFKEADSKEKYLIRLFYYPLIVEVSLTLTEYGCRTFDRGGSNITVNGRAHFIFYGQATFAILGRYLTIISGSLVDVTLISIFHFMKDVFVHRLSWLQCKVAHKVKRVLRSKEGKEDFDKWFYSPNFQKFRACVFNNDFVIEVSGRKRDIPSYLLFAFAHILPWVSLVHVYCNVYIYYIYMKFFNN